MDFISLLDIEPQGSERWMPQWRQEELTDALFIYFEIPDVPVSVKSDVWKRFGLPRVKRQERGECDRQPSHGSCQSSAAPPLHCMDALQFL